MGEQSLTQKNSNNNKSVFERVIKPMLKYVGLIGACIMAILYIAIVIVLITGFKQHVLADNIVFAVVTSGVGLIIMQFLKLQGITFAKELPHNKEVIDEYNTLRAKEKKLHSINYYLTTSTIFDIISKGITIIITTTGIIYIIIQGMHDYTLLLLAVVNLLMFICFGMLSMSNAFDYFNDNHIPYVKEKIRIIKESENEHKLQRNKQPTTRPTKSGGIQQKKKCRTGLPNRTTSHRC